MAYNGKKNADASRRRPESLGNAFENYPVLRYVLPLAIGIAVGYAGRSVFSEYSSVFFAATLVSAALLIAMLFVKHYRGVAQCIILNEKRTISRHHLNNTL